MAASLSPVTLVDAPGKPVLVLGPSIGTTPRTLWQRCADLLDGRFHVIGWQLPGHGGTPAWPGAFTMAHLARAVLDVTDAPRFSYAGDSIGGAVGLRLLLDAPDRVEAAVLLCTGARIGQPAGWHERAATVRAEGLAGLVEASRTRWFGPGFADREPEVAGALLESLGGTDPESYASACEALAGYDVRDRLGEITAPVLAVAGTHDPYTPPESLAVIARDVRNGRLVVLDDCGHQAPAEYPARVADLIVEHLTRPGMSTRRAVLGDAWVDRATAGAGDFGAEFQDFLTRYAWGEIWGRPGLDRRSRSLITLTALVALGHHEELAGHVRGARRNGLTVDEIKELLLQTAIYCGVPAAAVAFRVAQRALDEVDAGD